MRGSRPALLPMALGRNEGGFGGRGVASPSVWPVSHNTACWIELIVCKVERVYLCLYCCKARLGIVVSPSVLNELRDWAQRKSRKEA
jgi:hypothetical protein